MLGLKLRVPNLEFLKAAREAGILLVAAGDNVVRLLPPLIIDESHVAEAGKRLRAACHSFERAALVGAAQ